MCYYWNNLSGYRSALDIKLNSFEMLSKLSYVIVYNTHVQTLVYNVELNRVLCIHVISVFFLSHWKYKDKTICSHLRCFCYIFEKNEHNRNVITLFHKLLQGFPSIECCFFFFFFFLNCKHWGRGYCLTTIVQLPHGEHQLH